MFRSSFSLKMLHIMIKKEEEKICSSGTFVGSVCYIVDHQCVAVMIGRYDRDNCFLS